jgi:hypothetical protein
MVFYAVALQQSRDRTSYCWALAQAGTSLADAAAIDDRGGKLVEYML